MLLALQCNNFSHTTNTYITDMTWYNPDKQCTNEYYYPNLFYPSLVFSP